MPSVFKPSSTESSRLAAGLPTRVESPQVYVELTSCKGSAPAFWERCPSHLNHPTLFTLATSGSLRNVS
jgi:hypothetical protein